MPDNVTLEVAGQKIERFLSYRIDADLYCADDAFRLELEDTDISIDPGMQCILRVNGRLALNGIIDRVEDGVDKNGSTLVVEGRDLMGLAVDSYVERFPDLSDVTLKALADRLLYTVPFINRKSIKYQDGLAGKTTAKAVDDAAAGLASLGIGQKNAHVEPGKTVFEVLKASAASRGALFYSLPDGTFVFGRPKVAGRPMFEIIMRMDGRGNTAISAKRIRDISRRYSKITVMGQQQGNDLLTPDDINTGASVTDDDAPFYKPFVMMKNDDDKSPAEEARKLLEQQRATGFRLVYRVPGHSCNGRNWTINELCRVEGDRAGIAGPYLVYGRTFELNRKDGATTEVRLGLPGIVR